MTIMPVLFSNFWMKIRGTNSFPRASLRLLAGDGNGRNSRNILWFFHVYNICALFRVKLRVREITSPIAEARQQLLHSYLDQVGQIFIFRDKLGISRIPKESVDVDFSAHRTPLKSQFPVEKVPLQRTFKPTHRIQSGRAGPMYLKLHRIGTSE